MSSFSNKIQMCKQSALYVTLTTPSTAAPAAAAASVALDKQMQQEKCFRGRGFFRQIFYSLFIRAVFIQNTSDMNRDCEPD